MATLDGEEIVYVARVPAARSMSLTLNVGSRLPAYPTSMGRVLLAALPETELESYLDSVRLRRLTSKTLTDRGALLAELGRVAERGYATVDGEREEGVRSAAAPVRGSGGRVLSALNVSVNAARVSLDELHTKFVPRLVATAESISREISRLH
jgi:IclR family pca regulon transcriptional regulator